MFERAEGANGVYFDVGIIPRKYGTLEQSFIKISQLISFSHWTSYIKQNTGSNIIS